VHIKSLKLDTISDDMIADRSPEPSPRLDFIVDEPLVARFFLLLQRGVRLRCRVGCSVEVYLKDELGVGPGTIEKIQSIMLDGKAVDDIGSAVIHDGSTLALSAALPGLVGATLRRGSMYSSFRSGITYHEAKPACLPVEGLVSIKLFNLLMAEMGPGLLRRGVFVNGAFLADFLAVMAPGLGPGCRGVTLDGRAIAVGVLRDTGWAAGADQVFLAVTASPARA
jgi:hypothetical protein